MIEKQAFRFILGVLLGLALGLGGVACRPVQLSLASVSGRQATFTRTPFQAQSPTPHPTLSYTPTSTFNPASTVTSTLAPSSTPDSCPSHQGRMESFTVKFSNPTKPLTFRVYLPPCYGAQEGYRYPVLYLIHGQTYREDQWDRLGIDEAADELIGAHVSPLFLIVMPLEEDTYENIYTASFPVDLVEGLVPWMDTNYPTCTGRICRAIGGLSRGGAWALRLGFMHWEVFGSIGLHSTPPFTGDPNLLSSWLKQIPAEQLPRIYMDTGKRDWYLEQTSQFEHLLVTYAVPHEWYLFNGTHEEAYWSAHVLDYLAWYTQPWKNIGP